MAAMRKRPGGEDPPPTPPRLEPLAEPAIGIHGQLHQHGGPSAFRRRGSREGRPLEFEVSLSISAGGQLVRPLPPRPRTRQGVSTTWCLPLGRLLLVIYNIYLRIIFIKKKYIWKIQGFRKINFTRFTNIVQKIIYDQSINLQGLIYGQSISLILAAIGNGDVVALSLRHSNSSYHSTTLARFQNLSSIKILNIFITRTTLVSENEIHLEFLSANGKAELIKRTMIYTLEQNGDQFKETATLIGDQVLKVNQKTQFICGTLIESLGIFVVGDTKGNIYLFDYSNPTQELFSYQYLKAHNNERVLSLFYCDHTHQLYSSSKDNFVNIYALSQNQEGLYDINKVQSVKEEDMNIIYQIAKHGPNKMMMLGFYGKYAYLWDKQEGMQVMSINCNGGNRPIRLRLQGQYDETKISEEAFGKSFALVYSQGDQLTIVNSWQKKEQILIEAEKSASQQFTLKDSLHGREILAACAFSVGQQQTVVLTGSEDTFLKVNLLTTHTDGSQHMKPLYTFANHVASIRSISKFQVSPTEFLVLSAGSRMQAQLYKATFTPDFVPTDFKMIHICQFMKSFDQDPLDQDYRIMSSVIIRINGDYLCLFGTSSGQLLTYSVNLQKHRLEEVQSMSLQFKASVLSIEKITLNEGNALVVAGLSNGEIQIVNFSKIKSNVIQTFKAHDFGVNSLDAKPLQNGHVLIVSGGDDQQLTAVIFDPETSEVISKTKQYAHSSCIKGVTLLEDGDSQWIASSSYDQRFKKTPILLEDGVKLGKAIVVRHCMSDMNGITSVQISPSLSQTIIVGQGLAIF